MAVRGELSRGGGKTEQIYGCAVVGFGLLLGRVINRLGVRSSLILGSCLAFVGRSLVALVRDPAVMTATFCTVLPIASAFTSPVLKLGLRRFSNDESRAMSFQLSYIVMNVAAVCAAAVIWIARVIRREFSTEETHIDLVLQVCCVVTVMEIAMALALRVGSDRVDSDQIDRPSGQEPDSEESPIDGLSLLNFLAVSVSVSVGVGALMRHFGATFPTFLSRLLGGNQPFELLLALNPLIVTLFLPLLFWDPFEIFHDLPTFPLLVGGSALSALAPFILAIVGYPGLAAMSTSASFVVMGVAIVIFTLGELCWSPRFLQFAIMAGREGQEGMLLALSMLPKFLSRIFAGGLSGYLLGAFCRNHDSCDGWSLWSTIGLFSALTPAILAFVGSEAMEPKCCNRTKEDIAVSLMEEDETLDFP